VLYLVGFLKHETKPEFEVMENDPSAEEDATIDADDFINF